MATPKIIPYTVKLRSVVPEKTFSKPPVVYTNDLRSAVFQFTIIDMEVSDLTNATAKTMLYMRDGSFFQNPPEDVELVGTTFSYNLKENEGNHAGIGKIQLIVTIDDAEYATQLFDFEIINGLETKVAQEVMIYDWTTLTRDARAYIDQFVADEVFRDAQFDNAQFDRNAAFVASQDSRTTAFNESELGRTTAETGRVNAESSRVTAETGRTTAESNRVTAESNRVTAEGNRVTAESGRVTAFAGYNARITGMESDVNFNVTNKIGNGDFSNGTTDWYPYNCTVTIESGRAKVQPTGQWATLAKTLYGLIVGNKYFFSVDVEGGVGLYWGNTSNGIALTTSVNGKLATTITATSSTISFGIGDNRASGWTPFYADNYLVLDLTTIFGAGNEPTTTQMNEMLARFPNSWFDGTKNLFRASETLKKQIVIDARTEFEAKNRVTIGDVQITAPVGTSSTMPVQSFSPFLAASKYYLAYRLVSTGTTNTRNTPAITLDDNTFTYQADYGNYNITTGFKSWVFTASKSVKSLNWWGHTLDVPTVVDKFVLIDLTATFGAGKEPTQAEMDRLMARFPNSWFDGVKPIQTIETLYQEKANKVQEAWITPTLLNGWTNYGTDVLKMYKDEFGIVHIRGRVRGGLAYYPLITLPVGYRPIQGKYASNVASIGAILAATKKLFMVAAQGGTDNRVFIFDGIASDWSHAESFLAIDISYRAEA